MIALVYYIFAFFHTIFMEFLLFGDRFYTAAKIELITVLLQVGYFLATKELASFSTASSVLISFSVSYLSVCIYIVWKNPIPRFRGFSNPSEFWKLTKGRHLIGTVIGALDRMDRILIAFLLPTTNLCQYSTMGSLLSFFRFLPEAISKIIISGPVNFRLRYVTKKPILIACVAVLVLSTIVISRFLIGKFLGSEWLLSVPIYITFALYEIFRGLFQISYNQRLAKSRTASNWVMVNLTVLSLFLATFLGKSIGLVGIPLGFGIGYLISYWTLKFGKKS
jgi:hypothetical protein